jgi:hypothetical protein
MPLPLRERQRDAVVRMLNLNAPPARAQGLDAGAGEVYKVLVMDRFCFEIVTPLIKVNELRKHGVTLHLLLENDRERIADVPAVYFCQPTPANVALIANDFARNLYDAYHLNFSSSLPRASLEELAAHSVKHRAAAKVAKVFDQYVNFVSLGPDVFSLAQRDAYVSLNDPTVSDERVEGCVAEVVRGLFGACATLGRAPIIRCPRGGAAEMIARELEKLLRDHVAGKGSGLFANDLMSSSSSAAAGGAQPSQQRPLLCIFDRNFDVAAALQHPWTYQPLVHDILGMRLNRVDVAGDDDALDKAVGGRGASKKSYELEESADPFWRNHGDAIFPRVAEEVEAELTKYKKAMADINDKTSKAGTSSGTSADGAPDTGTSSLVSAVASLPELQERKKMIDKHTNVATALLREIKRRGIDEYHAVEEDLLCGKGDKAAVMSLLDATGRGTAQDKLRLAIIAVIAEESSRRGEKGGDASSTSRADQDALEAALVASGADAAALAFVRRMASLNAHGGGREVPGGGGAGGEGGDLLEWADKLYGQSISQIAKGVKSLLSGERRLAVARATESLMANQPSPETEAFAVFDPKAPRRSDGEGVPGVTGPGAATADGGGSDRGGNAPFNEAVAFVVGGGTFAEFRACRDLANGGADRGGAGGGAGTRSVVYGGTEFVTGAEFVEQLGALGRKSA